MEDNGNTTCKNCIEKDKRYETYRLEVIKIFNEYSGKFVDAVRKQNQETWNAIQGVILVRHFLWFLAGVVTHACISLIDDSFSEKNKPLREGIARFFRASMSWLELPSAFERSFWLVGIAGVACFGVWIWYRLKMKGNNHAQ